jgi:molybdopterin-biosynthesis enzyme MoeA-like protein
MGIHAIIIGDEILSGKRQDKHLAKIIEILKHKNMRLTNVSYIILCITLLSIVELM